MSATDINDHIGPLSGYFSEKLGQDARVTEIKRLAEGHSRQMLHCFVDTDDRQSQYVLRVEQDGIFGTSGAEEFRIMGALHKVGFPVARVLWLETERDLLGEPFFVMDYVDGDPEFPVGETLSKFVRVLSRLHNMDWEKAGLEFDLMPATANEATHQQIDRWTDVYRSASTLTIPLLEEGAAWLHHYAPVEGPMGVVHGDPGPGNLVHRDGKILALTDFEFCHLGHPFEDFVFCAAMRGPRSLPTEGWIELYSDLLGTRLTDEEWRYWQIFNLFKGACANTTSLRVFCAGNNPAPNLAIVGTAIHQNFLRQLSGLIG